MLAFGKSNLSFSERLVLGITKALQMAPLTLLGGLAFVIVYIYGIPGQEQYSYTKTVALYSLYLTMPLGVAIHYATVDKSWVFKLLASIVVVLLLGYQTYDKLVNFRSDDLVNLLQVGMAHLAVAVAARPFWSQALSFWAYNARLLGEYLRTAFMAAVMAAGVMAALGALDLLLGINVSGDTYLNTCIAAAFLVHPFMFLAALPKEFVSVNTYPELSYPKFMRNMVQYVLLPLVVLYIVILYAYGIKLVVGEPEKGLVGWLVLALTLVGVLAYLLAWPMVHDPEERWVKLWDKYYWLVVAPLCLLLLWSVNVRVESYGLTANRVMLYYLCAWLIFVVVYMQFIKRNGVVVVPLSLLVLFLQAAYGIGNANALAINDQKNRFYEVVRKYNIKAKPIVGYALIESKDDYWRAKYIYMPNDSTRIQDSLVLEFHEKEQLLGALNYLSNTSSDLVLDGFETYTSLKEAGKIKMKNLAINSKSLGEQEFLDKQIGYIVTKKVPRDGILREQNSNHEYLHQASIDFQSTTTEPISLPEGYTEFVSYSSSYSEYYTDSDSGYSSSVENSKRSVVNINVPYIFIDSTDQKIKAEWLGQTQTVLDLSMESKDYFLIKHKPASSFVIVPLRVGSYKAQVAFTHIHTSYVKQKGLTNISFDAHVFYNEPTRR